MDLRALVLPTHCLQLMRIGQIFGEAFGKAEVPNGRVRPVLAGQEGDGPQWEGLQYLDAVHGHPSDFIHATANAPYFAMNSSGAGRDSPNCKDGWTASQVCLCVCVSVRLSLFSLSLCFFVSLWVCVCLCL